MAAASAITATQGSLQFQSYFSNIIAVSCTLDAASLVDAAGETDTVAVPGAKLGDIVIGPSFNVDLVGITVTAYVSAADVVSLRVQNEGAATTDLASCTVKFLVARPKF